MKAKIIFHHIKYKNFLSTGNSFNEIKLDSHKTTLVSGKNGSGKSSALLDSLFYALYGKAFRDVKVGQLVNSINNKNCVVELEFSILGNRYKVIRGQKPAIFEIYKNGEIINQEGDSRDYQKILENQILKIKPSVFKQLVVIGAASYTQFMNLKPAERRSVIEDILEISVFTKMAELSRAEEKSLKSSLNSIESEISIRQETIKKQQGLIEKLESEKEQFQLNHQKMVSEIQEKLTDTISEAQEIIPTIGELKEKKEQSEKIKEAIIKAEKQIAVMNDKIKKLESDLFKSKQSDRCPTCDSELSSGKQEVIILDLQSKQEEAETGKNKFSDVLNGLTKKLDSLGFDSEKLSELESILTTAKANAQQYKAQLKQLESMSDKFSGLEETKKSLNEEINLVVELSKKRVDVSTDLMYYNLISAMLKDNGIKATIVQNYLPIINQFINEYLESFDLFVGFELSPTFEETIKSRHRDAFSYASFSEGEKTKIDLSILLTWRKIASLKSAASTNLLILDEVGSSTLDSMVYNDILRTLFESSDNVFSISHRTQDLDLFDRILTISKPKNFSIIEESSK